ncbi:hypothetical protein K8R42_04640 [bacterium]|nr:hypothetical protein [bacterium]
MAGRAVLDRRELIGKTIRVFADKGCVGIKMSGSLATGDKVCFQRNIHGSEKYNTHRSVHIIETIEIDHERQGMVNAGQVCAVQLRCPPDRLPPYGCEVLIESRGAAWD